VTESADQLLILVSTYSTACEEYGSIKFLLLRPDGSDIASPLLIGTTRRKILIQQVWGHSCSRFTCGRGRPMMPTTSGQTPFSHQTSDPLAGTGNAPCPQFGMDTWTPIHLSAGLVGFLNVLCELAIFLLMFTHRTLLPGIIPTQRDTKGATEHTDRIVLAMIFNNLVPHSWPCEKMDTVFLAYRVPVAFSPVPV